MRIWTLAYYPFVFGGNVWQPVSIDVAPHSEHTIDLRGITVKLATFQNPITKLWHVAESSSGGLCGIGRDEGLALGSTVADICSAPSDWDFKKQLEDVRQEGLKARIIESDEFWKKLANSKDEQRQSQKAKQKS